MVRRDMSSSSANRIALCEELVVRNVRFLPTANLCFRDIPCQTIVEIFDVRYQSSCLS